MRATLLLPLLALLACGGGSSADMSAYHTQVAPLMADNTRLASRFLALARVVHQEDADMDTLVVRMDEEILPLAKKLASSMGEVEVKEEELQDLHQVAVNAWRTQASAYGDMVAAYKGNDLERFSAAHQELSQAKVAIENYVREVNRLLLPHGYHLDEFPKGR